MNVKCTACRTFHSSAPPYQNVCCAGGLLGDLITTIMLMWPNPGRQSNIIANKLVMVAQDTPSPMPNPMKLIHNPALLAQFAMCVAVGWLRSGMESIQQSLTREPSEGPTLSVGRCVSWQFACHAAQMQTRSHVLAATNCGASYSPLVPMRQMSYVSRSFSCSSLPALLASSTFWRRVTQVVVHKSAHCRRLFLSPCCPGILSSWVPDF